MARLTQAKTSEHQARDHEKGLAREAEPLRGPAGPHAGILALQRTAGNRAVSDLLASGNGNTAAGGNGVPPIVHSALKRGGGQPLEPTSRASKKPFFGQQPDAGISEGRPLEGPALVVASRMGSYLDGIGRIHSPESNPESTEAQANQAGLAVSGQQRFAGRSSRWSDFSGVRIHTDSAADRSARSIGARAYTYGSEIYFANGQFNAASTEGRSLLGHELAHVSQQKTSAQPRVQKQSWTERAGTWYEKKKWAAYRAMIKGMKSGKDNFVRLFRSKLSSLPQWAQGPASSILDATDFVIDMLHSLCLAIIGLVVGFVEGIVALVVGLVRLAYGLLKLIAHALYSIVDKGEAFKSDLEFLAAALKNFFPALKKLVSDWLARYQKATLEEQVLMGGELVGQIEAFIATFLIAGTKAGQAGTLAVPTGVKVGTEMTVAGVTETGAAVGKIVPTFAITTTAVPAKTLAQAGVVALQATALSTGGGGGGGGGPEIPKETTPPTAQAPAEKPKATPKAAPKPRSTKLEPGPSPPPQKIHVKEPGLPPELKGQGMSTRKQPKGDIGGKAPPERAEAGTFAHENLEKLNKLLKDEKKLKKIINNREEEFVKGLKEGLEKEHEIPVPEYRRKPRADRVDWDSAEVIEIKPKTLEKQGLTEARQYAEWMNKYEKRPDGKLWKPRVITYDLDEVVAFLKRNGYLPE